MSIRFALNLSSYGIYGIQQATEAGRRRFYAGRIVIVVAIIALLATIAVPGFLRARKRVQATAVKNDLRLVEAAVEQYAIETGKTTGAPVAVQDWTNYIARDRAYTARGKIS